MTEKNNYLFFLNKNIKPKFSLFFPKNEILDNKYNYREVIIEGPTGPSGLPGDRFATKTLNKISLFPKPNATLFFEVEPGLAFISGNSVIVAEVADSINSVLNTFEATVQFYSKSTGQIVVKDIVNIHGTFGINQCYYYVNLDGVDGAPGEEGPTGPTGIQGPTGPTGIQGPTGPSNISEEIVSIQLINDKIIIPQQINAIAYYSINLKNNDELINIESNLKNNQMAIILLELQDINNSNSNATIYAMEKNNIKTNYKNNIQLNSDLPYIMLKIYNIKNHIFIESVSYYKNNYITV